MADGGHVLAQRDADRCENEHAARDRAADELHHHAGSAHALSLRIALPPTLAPQAFAGHDPSAAVKDLAGETMGTTWSVRYAAPRGSDAAAVREAIVARLAGLVGEMSHWVTGSLLSRFNRSTAGTWTKLPPDFSQVMSRGLAIARETGGAFDPAIGALVDLWGFGPTGTVSVRSAAQNCHHPEFVSGSEVQQALPVQAEELILKPVQDDGRYSSDRRLLPSHTAIATARCASSHHRLAYHPADRLLHQPGGVSLDLSGIAKGHAVDAIADLLATHGIRHCLVEIGGELVGRGIRPDGDPWWVDLESPPEITLPPLRIALHGLAVATSGNYRRGAHTLDPRTGRPIGSGVVSCSVIHRTALDADAWATAFTVLGVPESMVLAERRNIAARLVTVHDGVATEHLSPALAAMLAD